MNSLPAMTPQQGGWLARLKSLLGSFYNLFPLGGANGGIIVRQKGGVAGTNELQLYHDGTNGYIFPKIGALEFTVGATAYCDNQGHIFAGRFSGFSGSNTLIYLDASGDVRFSSATTVCWSNSTTGISTLDTGLIRTAAGVLRTTAGISGNGWLQNSAGEAALANAFTNNTATLAATNLSLTVIAGRSYRIHGVLQVSNSTTTEGVQFDFGGGTATASTFFVGATAIGSVTPGTLTSTSLTGAISYSVITGTDYIVIDGYLKVNAGGTLVLRAAENSTLTGTLTVGAGSNLGLSDTVTM